MEKYEIIFFVIAILAYIICSMTLKIPIYAHLMLGTILSIILILAVLLKLQEKYYTKFNCKLQRMRLPCLGLLTFPFKRIGDNTRITESLCCTPETQHC